MLSNSVYKFEFNFVQTVKVFDSDCQKYTASAVTRDAIHNNCNSQDMKHITFPKLDEL